MKINEEIKIKINDVGINGEGIAKFDNTTIFVPFALTNEIVKAKIIKIKNNIAFAKLTEIVSQSENRIKPQCSYFQICGGCNIMHTNYQNQLKIKTANVYQTLSKQLKTKIVVNNCIMSNKDFFYRNKVELVVKNNLIGFYQTNSHNIVEIENCLLCDSWLKIFISIAKQNLTQNKTIHHITLRYINENLCIVFITKTNKKIDISNWINLLQKNFSNFSIFQNINPKENGEIFGEKFICLYGSEKQLIKIANITIKISPDSFLQTNKFVESELYNYVNNNLNLNYPTINAYSGAGYLSAIIANKSKNKVFGIEINNNATKNANQLAKENNINNMTNFCGDAKEILPKLIKNELSNSSFNLIIDPPRRGIAKEVIFSILENPPETIIYISCNPATLGRDLKFFEDKYNIVSIQPFDMFPQTKHIETVVKLNLKTTKIVG